MANIKQIVLKDAEGNVLGTYDIKDANVPHSSETAVSGGTTLSLVTTGEKYIWDNKPTTVSGLTDTTISSPQMYDRLTYENTKWVNENSVYIRNGEHLSLANENGLTVLDAYNTGGGYIALNSNTANTIILRGSDGNITANSFNGKTLNPQVFVYPITKVSVSASSWLNVTIPIQTGDWVSMTIKSSASSGAFTIKLQDSLGTLYRDDAPYHSQYNTPKVVAINKMVHDGSLNITSYTNTGATLITVRLQLQE